MDKYGANREELQRNELEGLRKQLMSLEKREEKLACDLATAVHLKERIADLEDELSKQ